MFLVSFCKYRRSLELETRFDLGYMARRSIIWMVVSKLWVSKNINGGHVKMGIENINGGRVQINNG